MAYLIATADGNWTDAATWGAVDATSLLDSEANTVFSTTSYVESATFTPGAITVDGIAVKVANRANPAVGTFSVRLAQGGVTVAGTEVTLNCSDLINNTTSQGATGWVFCKFAAPVTLLAATLYTVSQKSSTNTTMNYYRNATAGNISRMLRTTTTAAPGAGDSMFILGEFTAAATKTNRAVTMNETAATDYGSASTTLSSLGIGNGGTLAYGVASATDYLLRLSGVMDIWTGGIFTMGTAASPVPRDSTAILEFDCGADGDFGLRAWSTMTMETCGMSRTAGKDVVQCLLNTDEAIAQTVLGVDTDTGWLDTDEIAIASTTQTAAQAEAATLSGNAAATTITISAGLSAAHGGSAATLVQAEVILLTRNVKIRAVTSTFAAYMTHDGTAAAPCLATFTFAWTEFRYLGTNSGTKNAILRMATAWPVSVTVSFCAFRDGEGNGFDYASSTSASDSAFTMSDSVFYRVGIGSSQNCIATLANVNASISVSLTRVTGIYDDSGSSSPVFLTLLDPTSAFVIDGLRVSSGTGRAMTIGGPLAPSIAKRIVNSNFHCMGTAGVSGIVLINGTGTFGLTFDNCVFWRNNNSGSSVGAVAFTGGSFGVLFSDCTFFGNNNAHLAIAGGAVVEALVRNSSFSGDSSFATIRAWETTQGNLFQRWRFENCTFGVATGIRVAHSTEAIGSSSGANNPSSLYEFTMVNCNIADATEFGANWLTSCGGRSFIVKQRRDGTTNVHETIYPRLGTVAYDTTTFRTAAPSQKLTPTVGLSGAGDGPRLRTWVKTYPVASGKKITFSVYVQKDGSYDGAQPRLVLLANPAVGIDDDVVLDTLSIGSGSWELLTGQMAANAEENGAVQAVVECDGSAGNVYVDDWSAATT